MLAFMPQSSPLGDLHAPKSLGSGTTMSLAILPSAPMAYSQPPLLDIPSPSKRPKLSLNTSKVAPISGKGSTSLRLETLSATSPTTRNTFRNAQNPERASGTKPKKPTLTPLATEVVAVPTESPSTPSCIQLPDPADTADSASSSAASISSNSTIDSLSSEIPYKLPFNVTSILTNGPLPRARTRTMSFAQSKPMFPAAKKVAFRAPLAEEIKTTKYTLSHSDIDSSTSTISTLELSPPEKDGKEGEAGNGQSAASKTITEEPSVGSPQTGEKRESSDEEDDNDSCPATPFAGRRKKSRQWIWTLGPITSVAQDKPPEEAGIGEEKTEVT